MPGTGPHDHLKPEVIALFRGGAKPREIMKAYPQIPQRTLYNWHNVAREQAEEAKTLHLLAGSPKSSDPANVTLIDGFGEKSDIGLARQTLRSVCKDRSVPASTKVQAALGLMRLAYLRSELPKHIIEETTTIDIDTHKREVAEMDEAELQRRIKEKMA